MNDEVLELPNAQQATKVADSKVTGSNVARSNDALSNASPCNVSHSDVDRIPISLAYAPTPTENLYLEIEVPQNTNLLDALALAGWLAKYPELNKWCEAHRHDTQIDNKHWYVGVFSQKKLLSYMLQAHDRVEIYRPLAIDPMRKRKRRADAQ